MDLSEYSIEELQNLELLVAIGYENARKQDTVFMAASALRWAERIKEAIKDRQFELSVNPLPY